jgi:hypothetical protein
MSCKLHSELLCEVQKSIIVIVFDWLISEGQSAAYNVYIVNFNINFWISQQSSERGSQHFDLYCSFV